MADLVCSAQRAVEAATRKVACYPVNPAFATAMVISAAASRAATADAIVAAVYAATSAVTHDTIRTRLPRVAF